MSSQVENMRLQTSHCAPLLAILWPLVMTQVACAYTPVRSAQPSTRVRVQGGRFTAGLDDKAQVQVLEVCRSTSRDPSRCTSAIWHGEGRAVTVSVSDFEIDRLEVSQAQYQTCIQAGACTAPDVERCVYGDGSRPTDAEWAVLGRPAHPVVCVAFHQAEAYCRWAKGHVPTEVEWERAARGADGRMFPWGNDWRPSALNWGDDGEVDGHRLTAPVGSYPTGASPYGALDMVGNVWEWVYRLDALDTDVQADRQVIRGGGFAAAPHAQRTTKRAAYVASQPYPNVGFRCAYGGTNPSPAHR